MESNSVVNYTSDKPDFFNHEYDYDRIGRHQVLLAINHDCNKICDFLGFFQSKQEKFREFFASSDKKAI